MSHIVQIHTQVRDPVAINAACRRLQIPEAIFGSVRLFNAEMVGWQVQLPNWRYPVVCDTLTGDVHFDNFNGHWGDRKQLDRFLQNYSVEKARVEARKAGHAVIEQHLPDGFIKLTIQVGVAA